MKLDQTLEIINDKDKTLNYLNNQLWELKGHADNSYNEKIKNISNILKEEIPTIIDLYESLPEFEGPNNIAQRATILKEKIEEKLRNKELSWVVGSADLLNGDMSIRLKESCPNLTEKYIILFSLYSLGFSSKAAAILLNVKRNAVDQRKRRLKEAIINSGIEDKEAFIKILS